MIVPYTIGTVIERVRDHVPALRVVGGAADYASAYVRAPAAMPAAFVVLSGEQIDSESSSGLLITTIRAQIDVCVVVRSYAAAKRGEAHLDEQAQIIAQVRACLNGWRPALGADIVETMRGSGEARVLRFDADSLWWVDPYEVTYRARIT